MSTSLNLYAANIVLLFVCGIVMVFYDNPIYTGTLTAAQVNAVAIDAGSIKTGTLSADCIAAGSISASKLDAVGIKSLYYQEYWFL